MFFFYKNVVSNGKLSKRYFPSIHYKTLYINMTFSMTLKKTEIDLIFLQNKLIYIIAITYIRNILRMQLVGKDCPHNF